MRCKPDFGSSRLRQELARWLNERFRFSHFITLTTHDPTIGRDRLRDAVKEWDARMNRALYGPKWRKHADELLWAFAFLEKPITNPHWHLLLRIMDTDPDAWAMREKKLNVLAGPTWQKLMPSGTVDVKQVTDTPKRLTEYVAKELGREIQYEDFITPDEFRRF